MVYGGGGHEEINPPLTRFAYHFFLLCFLNQCLVRSIFAMAWPCVTNWRKTNGLRGTELVRTIGKVGENEAMTHV